MQERVGQRLLSVELFTCTIQHEDTVVSTRRAFKTKPRHTTYKQPKATANDLRTKSNAQHGTNDNKRISNLMTTTTTATTTKEDINGQQTKD